MARNFLPDMECKETDEIPFCNLSSQNIKLEKLESKMKKLTQYNNEN